MDLSADEELKASTLCSFYDYYFSFYSSMNESFDENQRKDGKIR